MPRERDERGRYVSSSYSNRQSPSKSLSKPGRRSPRKNTIYLTPSEVSQYASHVRPQDMYLSDAYAIKGTKEYPKGLPAANSIRRMPSKHISPPTSISCTTWAGCVYSSMAADARAQGMKLAHGVDDMHKLLHTAKNEYPRVYDQLRYNPHAWRQNAELHNRVEQLYVPLESRRRK